MQNLEYNNVYIQKTRWRMYCYLQTNESDGAQMLSLMHLCEAQAAVARLQTYLHKNLDSSANKSKIYQTYVHHNIRTR